MLLSIVIGIIIVSVILYNAGNASVNNQVRSTMRLTSRRVSKYVHNKLDSDHFGINLIGDSISRGVSTSSSSILLPSHDLYWVEARDMLSCSAIYFGDSTLGNMYGAGQFDFKTNVDPKNKNIIVPETRMLSKDVGRTNSLYRHYPLKMTLSESVHLQTIPDSKKQRKSSDPGILINAEYDPRTRDWYKMASILNTTLPVWSPIYRGASTNAWMFTLSRAIYRATDLNGPYTSSSSSITAPQLGVLGMDFDTRRLREILVNVQKEMFPTHTNDFVLSFFYHPMNTPPGTLSLVSSSDLDMFDVVNNVNGPTRLQMPSLLGSYYNAETNEPTALYPNVGRDVMKATIKSATRAMYLAKQIAENPNYNHYYEDLKKEEINSSSTAGTAASSSLPPWSTIDVNDPGNEWLVSAVQMDNVLNGIIITVASRRSYYYDFETQSIVGTVLATLAVVCFIAVILYLGENYVEKLGMTTTALSLGSMFVCFIFVIGLWIYTTANQMTRVVQILSDQLQTEVVEGLVAFLSIPSLINRWNYVLLQTGGLDLSMHNNSWNEPVVLSRVQLQTDSALSDEMRRRPSGGTRPYLIYGGSSDGGFAGCMTSSSSQNGALGLGISSIDVSTRTTDPTKIAKQHWAYTASGNPPSFVNKRIQYDLSQISNMNSNVQLYRRGSYVKEKYQYFPNKRGWYINQEKNPDLPAWSDIYVFNSNQKLGITGTRGYALKGNVLGDSNGSNHLSTVLAVDYTLDIVSDLLKSILDEMKNDIEMEGGIYVIENDGYLVGVSSNTSVVVRYPDASSSDQLGAPQRLLAQDSIDPVVQITYNELKGRTSAVTGQNEGEASGIASFNENGTNAFVAEGSEIGRVLIRTKKLRNGLNWTVVVAVSEDSFLHRYRVKEIQGVVVGVGMCCITVYILSIFLGMSASLQKIITQIESTIGKKKNLVGTASLAGSNTVRKKQRKLSMVDQARKNLESVDNEDSSFFGGVVQDETEYDDGDEANAVQNLSDLSPDSEEFFNIYCNILRAPVESANLAMRVHNEDEPRPPSVFGKLQQILKLHNQPLLEIFEQFDDNDDGSVSFTEFCNGLKYFTERVQENFHPTQAELVLLFDALDKNGDGSVSFDELLQDNNVRVSESSATAAEKQRALRYITMVFNRGLSLPYILQLERSLDFARLKGYDLFESYWYQFIYAFFIFLSLSLAFLEAPASYGNGPRTTYLTQLNVKSMMHVVLPINGICLMVYVGDMCFEVWLRGFREGGGQQQQRGGTEHVSKPTDNSTNGQNTLNVSRKPTHLKTKSVVSEEHKYGGGERSSVDMWVDGESEGGGGRDNNGSSALFREKRKCFDLFDYNNGGKLRTMAFARLILLSLMVFDFFYRVGKPYFTGPGTRDAEDNGDGIHRRLILYLPFSALIRPLWLLSRYRDVRRSLGNFIQTLVKATDVFILFVLLMTVGSIMGVLLLSGRMDDDNINNYNKFNNFLSGLLTLFVYMASAENYPDVAYPGTDCDRDNLANSLTGGVKGAGCPETAFHIYSILFSFAGAFLIVSLIIGVFEAEFAENTQKQEKKDRRNKRLGIIAAFILLDKDRGGTLDSNEFLSFINGTCETGRAFAVPPCFELSGLEFLELIDEMSHELNGNSTVALPNQVLVTPYRRCSVQRINIPKNWVVGKRILLQVEEESKDEVDSFTQNLSTQHLSYRNTDGTLKTAQDYHQEQAKLSAKLSVNVSANVSANKNQHNETEQERKNNGERSQKQQKRMVMYHFSIPPNVRPGQTNVLVCGYSSEQKQLLHNTVNHKNITFGTIESSELAHWYCYNQGNGRFPYDIEEEKLKQQQTQQGKESDIITFYRYAAADMCVTNNLLENKTLIDSGTSNTNNTSSADSLYEPVERNQQKLSSSTSFKMGGKEIDPAEAMQRWKNSIRDAFAIYLNSKQHKSIMLVLTMCNIMCLALYGTGDDHGAFENILDILSICFMIIGFVEIGLRIFCFGWRDFWHVNDDFFQQCANRFDFYVNCLTLFVIVIAVVSKIGQSESLEFQRWNQLSGSSTVKSNDWTRLILAVPILRAFSTIYLIRDIVMGMLTVFPQYVHVFTLLGVVLYFYAVLGCFLFASDFKYNQSYEIPDANFNSMLDSLITLFQLFVGEAWVSAPLGVVSFCLFL